MKNIIELENVSKSYPGFQLDHVCLLVKEGTIVGLIGENGAGKTTLMKAILNIISTSGKIKIFGKEYQNQEKEIKQDIGVVWDDSFLSEYLNPKQINVVMKDLYPTWQEEKYFSYLKEFHLPENKLIKDFSSGMKMKLKIITAISHQPKLLVLDEPTSGLDPIVRSEILEIFRQYILEDETRSILISSHITSDLEQIADYTIFLHQGRVLFDLPTADLLENYGMVKCSEKEFQTFQREDYICYRKEKYQYEVLVANKEKFRKKYKISTIDKPTMEEIMLFYVKGERK